LLAVPPSAGELSSSVIAIAASRGEIRKSARWSRLLRLLEFVGIVEIVGIVGICWTEVVGIFYKIKKICCKEAISNIIRIYLLAEKIPNG
jgi:hypothetical protein